jgi:hypothetical protein
MAAPLGHIYLALQLLNEPLKGVNPQEFLIGASFPDIRYPAQLPRTATHTQHVNLPLIFAEKDTFKQGMLFHSFVDQEREIYMREQQMECLLPAFPHLNDILKGLEDQLLYPKINDKKFIRLFDEIIFQEAEIVKNKKIIEEWHTQLQNYFFYGPTPQTIRPFIKNTIPHCGPFQGIAEKTASYGFFIGTKFITLNEKALRIINEFYDMFYEEKIIKPLNLSTSSHV